MGIVSGLFCYLLWYEKNNKAAKRHLIASIILSFVPSAIIFAISDAILAASVATISFRP